jgi:hypothetical protein
LRFSYYIDKGLGSGIFLLLGNGGVLGWGRGNKKAPIKGAGKCL